MRVAEALRISEATVRRLVTRGVLDRSKRTKALTITRASFALLVGAEPARNLPPSGCSVFTLAELAAVLSVHPETELRKIRAGELAACQNLGCVRVTKTAFANWMKSLRKSTRP